MNDILKKSTLFSFTLFLLSLSLCAQKNRFIYIQTEDKQPFYIRMDKKILSSSASGYIIIPKLTDSTYALSIGFPKNEWPEQNVTIQVKETDAGYLLKNSGTKGWGLFNLQTAQVLIPEKNAEKNKNLETELAGDEFSIILAAVVNDPAIAQRVVVKNETMPPEKSLETKMEENSVVKESSLLAKAEIRKLRFDVTAEGVDMTYLDIANGIADTVEVFIYAVKSESVEKPKNKVGKQGLAKMKGDSKNKNPEFIDMELQNPNKKPDSGKITTLVITEKEKKEILTNSNCKNLASREDFLNLRKQMTTIEDYDDMINTARKKFKDNCFTTEQIKNLGSLFLKDEGKYKFFNAAYPYVSDSNNFNALENQLTDKYFITKFKAMLHH
ncbi:MAG: DUF4476 domain-containing protein [Ferruginibacter sp.]